MRPGAQALHRWAGLVLALPLLVVTLTGAALLYRDAIERATTPALRARPAHDGAAAPGALIEAARAAQPDRPVRVLMAPRTPGAPWTVIHDRLLGPWTYLDPADAQVLLVRPPLRSAWGWLYVLHTGLILGEPGELAVGVGGLLLAGSVLAGLWLWWPERRWRIRRRGALAWRDAHLVGGVLAAPLLVVLALTGAALVFHAPLRALADALAPHGARAQVTVPAAGAVALSGAGLDRAVAAGRAALPADWVLRRITLPAPGRPLELRARAPGEWHPNGQSRVYVDPATATVLAVDRADHAPWPQRFLNNLYPWHIGALGALPARWLYLLASVVLVYLTLTGPWLWWRARRQRRRAPAPGGVRPATGSARPPA